MPRSGQWSEGEFSAVMCAHAHACAHTHEKKHTHTQTQG